MKKLTFISSIFVGILLIASCLGEGGHVIEVGSQPAVAFLDTDEQLYFYIKDTERVLPASTSSLNFSTGECALISYKVDLDDQEYKNDVTGAYYQVTLTSPAPTAVPRWVTESQLKDTATVLPNEWLINSFEARHACIRNQLFLYTTLSLPDSMLPTRTFNLSFAPGQEIKTDTTFTPAVPVCEMFLRLEKVPEGTSAKQVRNTHKDINAFSMNEFVSTFSQHAVNDSIYVRIKYAKSFNSDSTRINWGESQAFKIPVRR